MTAKGPFRFTTPVLACLAVAGWGWAFKLRSEAASPALTTGEGSSASKTSRRPGERDVSSPSIASRLPTQRSAQLLARIDEIAAAATPGETNRRLIDACQNTLLDPDFSRRQRDLALLIDLMRPEDAAAMHETFLALHREGRGFGPEYSAFAARWGEVDPVGALDYLSAEQPVRLPTPDFGNIVRGWAQIDPQAALKWMGEHPDLAESKEGWSAVINGWMRNDPKAATDYLLKSELPPNQMVQSVRYAAIEKQYSSGLADASDWIASLPDEGMMGNAAAFAWNAAAFNLSELPYETAADAWGRVGSEPWMRFEQFEHFANMIGAGRVNEQGTQGFLDALPARWPEEKIAARFSSWAASQPDQVSRWLQTAPDGAFKAAAMKGAGEAGLDIGEAE